MQTRRNRRTRTRASPKHAAQCSVENVLSGKFFKQLGTSSASEDFVVPFVDIETYSQQERFTEDILFAAGQKPTEAHVLLDDSERAL